MKRVAVEDAFAAALVLTAEAKRWNIIFQLARELEARRLDLAGDVIPMSRNDTSR